MAIRPKTRLLALLAGAGCALGGCKSVVEVQVECPRLCLSAPGPSLRGSASLLPSQLDAASLGISAFDGGAQLDASPSPDAATLPTSLEWEATLRFNDVVAQLPTAAVDISLDLRLTSVALSSTSDLSFVTDLRVFLRRTQSTADGGARSSTPVPACWSQLSNNPIAIYQGQIVPTGPTINLVSLVPDINLFDCVKDRPAKFVVDMGIEPSLYPTLDVPLTLSTCIGARSGATYP
jgi:hypothetical protein